MASTKFCEEKPFSASGLRYWASRLERERSAGRSAQAAPRIARVEVIRGAAVSAPGTREREDGRPTPSAESLAVECGGMRVMIRPGFDRGTLAAVLDVLATRGGAR